jgi:mannose-6-phosphate isomerase-like protein (cupin superfamily)
MQVPAKVDYTAPDGSMIRMLLQGKHGGMCHCTLPAGKASEPVYHPRVEEIWYFLSGHGQVWRKQDEQDEVVEVYPNLCLTIPVGTQFQFRATDAAPLECIIVTMPPWLGETDAVKLTQSYWQF